MIYYGNILIAEPNDEHTVLSKSSTLTNGKLVIGYYNGNYDNRYIQNYNYQDLLLTGFDGKMASYLSGTRSANKYLGTDANGLLTYRKL